MKKVYAVIDERFDGGYGGDRFEDMYDTEAEAMNAAESEWEAMSDRDKVRRTAFYVCEGYVDRSGFFEESRFIKEFVA